jgi:addiction module HigA family antidote
MQKKLKAPGINSPLKDGAPLHPGQYIRERVLKPKEISVTEAAKLIGISRPGVSNFLNGKVATTREMAARIERAFNVSAQTLLDMQAAYDVAHAKPKDTISNAKFYVPPFLATKANDIEQWASRNILARIRLSVFLRTLVQSTGVGLKEVNFPGNDDAEGPGWDGLVEATEGTPWIPEQTSGWEFGTNQDIKGKADGDFAKSVKAVSKADRERMTFVFVTPRRWSQKYAWIANSKAKSLWKDVRVYDAQDLEQWLEQSRGRERESRGCHRSSEYSSSTAGSSTRRSCR